MDKKDIKKVFVIDTCVIIYDPKCICKFEKHDIVIPTTVLEELDKFKVGDSENNRNVREFIRELDKMRAHRTIKDIGKPTEKSVSALCDGGVNLGNGLGVIQVKISRKISNAIKETYPEDNGDNRILSLVQEMQKDTREKRKVVFVTKDINLRIKADSIGIDAEDFENDKVSPSDLHVEDGLIENFPGDQIDELYSENEISADVLKSLCNFPLNANKYFTLKNVSKSTFAFFDYTKNTLRRVEKKKVSGIVPRNSEQVFAIDAILSPKIKLISLFGKAGTGKTLIAMAAALDMLKKGECNKIIIASANVPLSNKDIGALPGDIDEKVSPYMQGLFDNLAFIKTQLYKKEESDTASKKGRKSLEEPFTDEPIPTKQKPQKTKEKERLDPIGDLLKAGIIKIQPLASIRGRSFNDTIFIVDEAQNLTPHEVKTIVTRAGENTTIIFCGDVSQIDSPYLSEYSNGLSYMIAKMTGQYLFTHIILTKGERSELAELAANLL